MAQRCHSFHLEEFQLNYIKLLFERKHDGEYYILGSNYYSSDVAIFMEKFQSVNFVSMANGWLDESKNLSKLVNQRPIN